MRRNIRTATAADFNSTAQKHATAAWLWAIVAGAVYYFFNWWAVIPGALVILAVISSIGATKQARHLHSGTYRIPNPNNGTPDGDARK